MDGEDFTVAEVVSHLGLTPLGEGVWGRVMQPADRAASGGLVSAYRLLTGEWAENWRPVPAEERWTAYMGADLELELATETGVLREAVAAGSGLWVTVPEGGWLRARALGGWSLAGWIGLL